MSAATCPACHDPQTDGILCGRCHGRLEQDLAQVPALDTQLLLVLGNQTSYAARHGGRSAETPLVINPGVVEPRAELRAAICGWAGQVLKHRYAGVTEPPKCRRPCIHAECVHRRQAQGFPEGDTTAAGRWLFVERYWLRSNLAPEGVRDDPRPLTVRLLDEIGDACRRGWRLVDVPWDRVRFVFGEACIEDGCEGLLWAWPKAERPLVRCTGCARDCCAGGGHEWTSEQWRTMGLRIIARRESRAVVVA